MMEATQVIGTIGEDEPKTHSQPIPVVYMIDHLYAVDGGGEQALLKILRHLPRDRFSPSVVTFIAKDRSLELLHARLSDEAHVRLEWAEGGYQSTQSSSIRAGPDCPHVLRNL